MKISSDARDVLRGTVAYYHQTSDPSSQPARYADPLAVTSSLDHASQFSTTEGEGWNHLIAEYRHRWPESREGGLECHASQGCFWFRQRPPHNDQGTFPLLR